MGEEGKVIIIASLSENEIYKKLDEIKKERNRDFDIMYYASSATRLKNQKAKSRCFVNGKNGIDTYILTKNINLIHNAILRRYVDETYLQKNQSKKWMKIVGPIETMIEM